MPTYIFEDEPMTCVSLEQALGLNRGDITRLIIHPSTAVEVETSKTLTPANQTALQNLLAAHGLGQGRKPKE